MATTDDKKPRYFKDVENISLSLGKKKDGSESKQSKGWSLSGKTLFTLTPQGGGAYKLTITKVADKPWPATPGEL